MVDGFQFYLDEVKNDFGGAKVQVHRRGRAGQAGHRRHQGQEADPAGQDAHPGRRPACHDRLRAGSGQHRREDRLRRPDRGGRRSHPARSGQVSLHGAHRLVELAAEPPVRAMGLRAGLQEDRHHRRRLRLRPRGGRRLPARVRGLRRPDHPEDLAAARRPGLRAVHPDDQAGCGRDLLADGRPDVAALPQAARGLRQQEAGDRRRHQLRRVRAALDGRRGHRPRLGAAIQCRARHAEERGVRQEVSRQVRQGALATTPRATTRPRR